MLQWNVSDHFYQNRESIVTSLEAEPDLAWRSDEFPAFDALWMCVYSRLADLCVDSRPAVRKSAGQSLFSMLAAHGNLLQPQTWHSVLWKVRARHRACSRCWRRTATCCRLKPGTACFGR